MLPINVSAAFLGTSAITINGSFSDWGTTSSPTTGANLLQDYSNTGADDGAGFAGNPEDFNYFWTGISTQSGGSTPVSSSNLIQYFNYRIDTLQLSTTNFTGNKFNIQLNTGNASAGYSDHLLQVYAKYNDTPVVSMTLFTYATPYPAMKAYTTGTITGVVSNEASPFSGYSGAVDTGATGAIGTYTYNSSTYDALEFRVPVSWYGSTYGGAIAADGSGAGASTGAVFSSTGSYGAVGTVKDTFNNSNLATMLVSTSTITGETVFGTTDISKLAFTTAARTVTAGVVSANMTVQTQDVTGAPQNVASQTSVNLTSSSANGKFYSNSAGTNQITSVNITAGASSAVFYYKDTTAGSPTITAAENPSAGWTDATQTETINADTITKMVFTTSAQSVTAGTVSGIMTLQTQDAYSNAKNVSSTTSVSLTSTSGNGTFYTDSGGTNQVTSVNITSGANTTSFYYKDTTAGSPTITAAENPSAGWTDATQTETINAGTISKMVFTTSAQSISAGNVSGIMTIQTQDAYSNAKNVSSTTSVSLTSTSGNGTFYTDSAGTNQVTSVNVTSGANTTSFYYKDTTAGSPTITAAENPSAGWTDATQTETINSVTISITNTPNSYAYGTVTANSSSSTGLTYFTVTNTSSVPINITISATDFTGGTTWTLSDTATAGADQCGLIAGLESGSYNIIVKKNSPYNTFASGLAASATQRWGLRLVTPTTFSDGGTKTGTVTLTATQQ